MTDEEFRQMVGDWMELPTKSEVYAAVAAHDAEVAAAGWDEACMAFGWALDNGPTEQAAAYVASHNPHRLLDAPTTPEGVS